jgi:peptidoglycan hydrolase CwlO-like protein
VKSRKTAKKSLSTCTHLWGRKLTLSQQKIQQLLKRHDELESENKRLLKELETLAETVSEQANRNIILIEQSRAMQQ